jgi:hypothetical protein
VWQAREASQERDDSNLHLGLGGMVHSQVHGGGSDIWNDYEDIRGSGAPWDDLEHVRPGMPTTWNVFRGNDDSQQDFSGLELDLDLGMSSGTSLYR